MAHRRVAVLNFDKQGNWAPILSPLKLSSGAASGGDESWIHGGCITGGSYCTQAKMKYPRSEMCSTLNGDFAPGLARSTTAMRYAA
jgi:hypothetical protein